MARRKGLAEEQLGEILTLLTERKRVIEGELRKDFTRVLEDTAEVTTVVDMEEGDESHVDVGKEMSFHFMSMRSNELKQIKDALLRIETGDYGYCEECGNAIRFERLKAMPFAQMCRTCQQDTERKEKERQWGPRGPYRV
jgi:DnaK suppressor protein